MPVSQQSSRPPSLQGDLLNQTREEAARRVALSFVAEAEGACARLGKDDEEALHDFRVAIRRLRSHTRSHRGALRGAVGAKHRQQLRDLQRATGGARDLEVQLQWIDGWRDRLSVVEQTGFGVFRSQLEARRAKAAAGVEARVARRFRKLHSKWVKRLSSLTVDLTKAPAPYRELLGEEMRRHVHDLVETSKPIGSLADMDAIHDTRIWVKRLRYLIEPVREAVPKLKKAVKKLKALQDVLGDIHDMQVLIAELDAARGSLDEAARPGITALRDQAVAYAESLFVELRSHWLNKGLASLQRQIMRAADELAREADVEVERKFLLTSLPPAAAEYSSVEMRQGYVPGEAVHERLREVRDGDRVRRLRTVKMGRGIRRLEFQEETTAAIFDAMWPLTEGARVHKRRYRVPQGDLVWEVDEFLDRDLILAEVELPHPDVVVNIPAWLQSYVDRDVTDDESFVNLNLAK